MNVTFTLTAVLTQHLCTKQTFVSFSAMIRTALLCFFAKMLKVEATRFVFVCRLTFTVPIWHTVSCNDVFQSQCHELLIVKC